MYQEHCTLRDLSSFIYVALLLALTDLKRERWEAAMDRD